MYPHALHSLLVTIFFKTKMRINDVGMSSIFLWNWRQFSISEKNRGQLCLKMRTYSYRTNSYKLRLLMHRVPSSKSMWRNAPERICFYILTEDNNVIIIILYDKKYLIGFDGFNLNDLAQRKWRSPYSVETCCLKQFSLFLWRRSLDFKLFKPI